MFPPGRYSTLPSLGSPYRNVRVDQRSRSIRTFSRFAFRSTSLDPKHSARATKNNAHRPLSGQRELFVNLLMRSHRRLVPRRMLGQIPATHLRWIVIVPCDPRLSDPIRPVLGNRDLAAIEFTVLDVVTGITFENGLIVVFFPTDDRLMCDFSVLGDVLCHAKHSGVEVGIQPKGIVGMRLRNFSSTETLKPCTKPRCQAGVLVVRFSSIDLGFPECRGVRPKVRSSPVLLFVAFLDPRCGLWLHRQPDRMMIQTL